MSEIEGIVDVVTVRLKDLNKLNSELLSHKKLRMELEEKLKEFAGLGCPDPGCPSPVNADEKVIKKPKEKSVKNLTDIYILHKSSQKTRNSHKEGVMYRTSWHLTGPFPAHKGSEVLLEMTRNAYFITGKALTVQDIFNLSESDSQWVYRYDSSPANSFGQSFRELQNLYESSRNMKES